MSQWIQPFFPALPEAYKNEIDDDGAWHIAKLLEKCGPLGTKKPRRGSAGWVLKGFHVPFESVLFGTSCPLFGVLFKA